jgi:hypothetical protein
MAKKNKMGYIFPKRIQSILRGESVRTQVGWEGTKEKKEGEIIVDAQGREWMQKNGYRIRVTKLDEARIPLFCPKCGRVMKKQKDPDIYIKFGFCFDCLIERDTKMMAQGTFWEYEKDYMRKKKIDFLNEAKEEIENYLANFPTEISYVDVDGSIEKWQGDTKQVKKFLKKELREIKKELKKLQEVEECQTEKTAPLEQ